MESEDLMYNMVTAVSTALKNEVCYNNINDSTTKKIIVWDDDCTNNEGDSFHNMY